MSAPYADASAATTTSTTRPVSMPAQTPAVEASEPDSSQVPVKAEPLPEPATTLTQAGEPTMTIPAAPVNSEAAPESGLTSSPSSASKAESAVRISLLLATGNRHPFTINNKFLQRHNIQATDNDPWNIKVYDMKTLIWHEWLGEWETRPTSPALIRLIFLGGLLDDKAALKDCRLSKTEPNVVHMTVKPQDLLEDDEVKGKEQKQGSTRQRRSGSSSCCVIL